MKPDPLTPPGLTKDELYLLHKASYDSPLFMPERDRSRKALDWLAGAGLLEKNPDSSAWRRTELGEEVLRSWKKAGF